MRPKTIAPWFRCRILTVEKEQTFGFTFQTNPMVEEYVEFNIKESESGVWLKCKRQAKGFFSIQLLKKMVKFGLPFIPAAFFYLVLEMSDRFILYWMIYLQPLLDG